jgi:hypothetical protein
MASRQVVRLRPGSDGDATHFPTQDHYTQVNPPTLYLEKLGQQWMEARGEAAPGVKYILEALPAGYTMWQRPRASGAAHVDKYLYGHPDSKPFDSPNRFYPHFEHLMNNNGSNTSCPCKLCAGAAGILPSKPASTAVRKSLGTPKTKTPKTNTPKTKAPALGASATIAHRPFLPPARSTKKPKFRSKLVGAGVDSTYVDNEGTPDVYRNLIEKLRRDTTIDETITEPLSLDWRAEQEILPKLLQDLREKEQWVPRGGDIVLYVRVLPAKTDLLRNEATGEIQLYNVDTGESLGIPPWEAGLVGETPAEPSSIAELHQSDRTTNVIYSGVRVEPMPDPNSADKSFSKRYKYVPLRQTRPFGLWKELLHKVPQEQFHSTIINALTLTSTLSLIGKHRFRGTWPDARVYCQGIYVGHELLAVGDTVRLLPHTKSGQTHCSDILVVKSIRLKMYNLDKASSNDYDHGRPHGSEIWIYGSAYTSDQSRSDKQWLSLSNVGTPRAASAYCQWYPLHAEDKELAVPCFRIGGRLYEREAMTFWLDPNPDELPDLDTGRAGLEEARAFAQNHDQRIKSELGATWYWGDDRADALNLKTINGLEVSKFDQERNVHDWRKKIKALDGLENDTSSADQKPEGSATFSANLRTFMAPGATDPGGDVELIEDTPEASSVTGSTSSTAKRKAPVIDLSDDEDQEEVRDRDYDRDDKRRDDRDTGSGDMSETH